jgi:tetratricopeptide (TPR) repeat protein
MEGTFASLGGAPGPSPVNQNTAHHIRRYSEEMRPILPADAVHLDQAQEDFVHQGSRLQSLAGPLFSHVAGRHTPQLDVHAGCQFVQRPLVAINQDDWFIPPADSAPKARAAAQKALSLEETDVAAHVVLAIEYDWYEWDWAAADREFRRAIELDPDNGDARGYYSWFLPSMGRNDEAVDQARQMQRMYPLSTGGNANLGSVLVFTHRWDEAIAQLRYSIDLNPNYWFDYYFLGRAYEQKGQLREAIEAFQRGLALEGNTELWAGLGHAYALSGKTAEARKVLERLGELSRERYVAPYNIALIHAGLGDKEAAFAWLERAYDARSYILAVYLNTDVRLRSLYGDPRYESLLQRMKLSAPK